MKYHLLVAAPSGPLPCGPREWDSSPEIGALISETIEGRRLNLEVVGLQQLPVIPGGTFQHDEVWVICKPLSG